MLERKSQIHRCTPSFERAAELENKSISSRCISLARFTRVTKNLSRSVECASAVPAQDDNDVFTRCRSEHEASRQRVSRFGESKKRHKTLGENGEREPSP
ncbi:Hypothetical predicted protein, partial [Olea europaea subsp. europaea]